MHFKTASPADIYNVAIEMRDVDLNEIAAVCWTDDRQQIAENLVHIHTGKPAVFAFGLDTAIAIWSAIEIWPAVWSLGFFATDSLPQIGKKLTKTLIRDIVPLVFEDGYRRVEARSVDTHTEAHKWMKTCGLKQGSTLKNWGKNGEDFIIFESTDSKLRGD
jgi:hypothetical protein